METFVRSVRSETPTRNAGADNAIPSPSATPRRARTMRASHSRRGRIGATPRASRRWFAACAMALFAATVAVAPTRVDAAGGVDAQPASGDHAETKPLTAVEMNTLRVKDHNPAGLLNAAHVRMPRKVRANPADASRDLPPSPSPPGRDETPARARPD